tara:strand:- start:355 stop:507 length:153 start_codon:yes stop_codon:yes gene_type:complete
LYLLDPCICEDVFRGSKYIYRFATITHVILLRQPSVLFFVDGALILDEED